MTTRRRFSLLVPTVLVGALLLPGTAFGQATRTWVSGVGDDANPCSRTAPCKTFAGAISKTAAGGEINVIDPGGFGGVTITKSLTIRGRGPTAGALVSGTNAIVINAAATDKVVIDGLDINGIGTGAQTSLTGIKVLSARHVIIRNSEIYRFKAGIVAAPTGAQTRVNVVDNLIHDNGIGVLNAPGSNAITFTTMTLRRNIIADNTCGAVVGSGGTNASTPTTTDCGVNLPGTISKTAHMSLFRNGIFDNATGVTARGSLATAELANNEVSGSSTLGLDHRDLATMRTFTPATNIITNNAGSDGFNDNDPAG